MFVQGQLCSISKLLRRAVYDWFFFHSFRKLTALLCLVCYLLFHSDVAEWSFLGVTGVVYSHEATYQIRLVFSAD